jgi:hypothetical protein
VLFPTDLRCDPGDIERRGIGIDLGHRQVFAADGTWRKIPRHRIVSRVGIMASLYFECGCDVEKRRAALACLQEYLSLCPDAITHYDLGDGGWPRRWRDGGLPPPYRESRRLMEPSFYLSMKRYKRAEHDDPTLYRFLLLASDGSAGAPLSNIKVHFPPSIVFADPDRFIALIGRWSSALAVVHGTAGLGALSVPGTEMDEPYHYPWLLNYPALEYDAVGAYFSEVRFTGAHRRPRSSNWLTILGPTNVAALGGTAAMTASLTPEMAMIDQDGVVIVRAAALPTLGDAANGGVPRGYRSVARLIRPIRFQEYRYDVIRVPFTMATHGAEETLNWIRRFD